MKHFKGIKTKLTEILLAGETEDIQFSLFLYKDGDLEDIAIAKYFTGEYIDLEKLSKQMDGLIISMNLQQVHLQYPSKEFDYDQLELWRK